ncbi:MAG: phosphatidic acid phosphatase [Clostridia bacterium]|nr:phosphatidic acid phosphatase [Clostridia bacterium]
MNFKFVIDYYRDLRPSNIKSPKYKHLLLLLFWPVFGLVFMILERIWPVIWEAVTGKALVYKEVVSDLDAYIPFCEWFVIPYYFWFVFLVGMALYGVLFDFRALRHYMWFVILTYSATAVIYLIWPNMQALRPVDIPRDNWMTDIVRGLYNFDTNTNVCPSIHVLGSLAVCFAGLHSNTLKGWGWKAFFVISTVLISLSTVFLKQHSIIDVFAALILAAVCYPIVFCVICREKRNIGKAEDPTKKSKQKQRTYHGISL